MILPEKSIVASGPVIIESGKVLLNKERKSWGITPWMFPGGEAESFDISLEDVCKREVKEEMGIDVEIVKPLSPLWIKDGDRMIILIHYLGNRIGEVKPGKDVADWGWHDINNLPADCAANVYEIIKSLK